MKLTNGFSKFKDRWNIKKEESLLINNLKSMNVDDPNYKATLDSVRQCSSIRNANKETVAKVLKDIGMLGICGGALFLSFGCDASDKIIRNKYTEKIFSKIFKP